MKISREEFLRILETVQPGLAPRERVEQSACFTFQGGQVRSFNEELAFSSSSGLDDGFTGAVTGKDLVELLGKLPDKELDLSQEDGSLLLRGKNRRSRLRMEANLNPDLTVGEDPEQWLPLSSRFLPALEMVQVCAAPTDKKGWELTCIHIHPHYVEASDQLQICRYKVKTGFSVPTLIRAESLKHAATFSMTEFGETDNWIHFRNPTGLVMCVRRFLDEYKDLSSHLEQDGEPVTLPKGLVSALNVASVFTKQNLDQEMNLVQVELRPGKVRLKGVGIRGEHEEWKKAVYSGKPIRFLISPTILATLAEKYNECVISERAIRVSGEKWVYVTALGVPEEIKT